MEYSCIIIISGFLTALVYMMNDVADMVVVITTLFLIQNVGLSVRFEEYSFLNLL